jgi:hypothetical protein
MKTIEIRDLPSGSQVAGFLFENPSHVYGLGDVLSVELPSGYVVDVGWDEDFPDKPFRIVVYRDYFGDRVVDFRVRDIDDVVTGVTQLAHQYNQPVIATAHSQAEWFDNMQQATGRLFGFAASLGIMVKVAGAQVQSLS